MVSEWLKYSLIIRRFRYIKRYYIIIQEILHTSQQTTTITDQTLQNPISNPPIQASLILLPLKETCIQHFTRYCFMYLS